MVEVVENLDGEIYLVNFLNIGNVKIVNLTLVKEIDGSEFSQVLPYELSRQIPLSREIKISSNGGDIKSVFIYPKILKNPEDLDGEQLSCFGNGVFVEL